MTERIISKIQEVCDNDENTPENGSAELEKLDEAIIVKALKSNVYDEQDIIKLNKLVLALEKPVP